MGCCDRADRVQPEKPSLKETKGDPVKTKPKKIEFDVEDDFDGPVKKRSCRDIFWLLLFCIFIGVLIFMGIYAFINGDLRRLINGYDNGGNICGISNQKFPGFDTSGQDRTKQPYLLYERTYYTSVVDVFSTANTARRCTDTCQTETVLIANRCIPKQTTDLTYSSIFSKNGMTDFFEDVTKDLNSSWQEIIYMCLIGFGLTILVAILLGFIAAIVVYVVLITSVITTIAGTIFLWVTYKQSKDKVANKDSNKVSANDENMVENSLIFAIIATVVMVLILIMVFVLRKRIGLVIQLFKEAGKAVRSMPFLLLQPVWTFLILILCCAGWLSLCLIIESSGFPAKGINNYVYFKKDTILNVARWYNIVALFWCTQFAIGCQHIIIAGAVATWFFKSDKDNLGMPILTSMGRLIRYHLGSVALGSLIVALVQVTRVLFQFVESRLKSGNSTGNIFSKCCTCCLMCLEKFLKYINRNAYIEIAIYGYNFCKSARKAFSVIVSNSLRIAAINSIGDFVLFLAKLAIVSISVLSGYAMLKDKQEIRHVWVPIVIAGLFTYFVSYCFICVYEMAIDTIFICFCVDMEHNDGVSRSYYMSKGLMEFVENSKRYMEGRPASKGKGSIGPTVTTDAWKIKPPFTIIDGVVTPKEKPKRY